jgi:hypothetical protein
LEDLVRAVERTELKPVIDTRYPISDLLAALDHLDPFSRTASNDRIWPENEPATREVLGRERGDDPGIAFATEDVGSLI